jgi:peptide/nickel transport system substrate-binding protein
MVVIENGNPGSGGDSPLYDLIFDQLITIDFNTGEYVGKVIKEWEFSEDRLSMTFTIHDNITFHDGTKATAEDVIYSLNRLNQPELARQSDRNVFGNIDYEKCEATGEYSGKLVFKTPTISIIPGLTKAWLLSKKHIEKYGEENAWWDNCIGTGMYKIESIIQGDRYNLVRNDNYWGGQKGAFEKIVIRYYAEGSTMYIDFESGVLDIIINPLSTDVSRIINGDVKNAVCDIYPTLQSFSVVFNEEMNPVLSNENVRKAICLAINPAIVTKVAYDFLGSPVSSIFPDGVKNAYIGEHTQNLEEAKKALAEAGYKPGELTLVFGTNTQNVNMAMTEALQAQIAEIGINIEIRAVDPNAHIVNFRNTGSDIYDMSLTMMNFGTLDSSPFLGYISKACGATSFAAAIDPYVDELALKAKTALTDSEKHDAITELQKYVLDHYWLCPIVSVKTAIVYKDYIAGIQVIQPRSPNLTTVKLVA